MPYVCSPLSCVCVLCVLFFICVSVGVCSCSFAGGRVWFYWCMCVSLMCVPLASLVVLSCLSFFVLWFFVAQVVCAFWGFVFLGWFWGCLVVVCGGCFLFFGVCRGFCFVGVVVFGVVFLFGRCGSIVCFVFWCVVWVGVLFLSVWVAGVYLCWWASAGGECFFWGGLFWLPCRVCWVVFVVCGAWVVFLVSLMCISLCVPLGCVAWVGWVGVFWGYGCGVLVFCFWRFLCLLVVVFCLVLVLW